MGKNVDATKRACTIRRAEVLSVIQNTGARTYTMGMKWSPSTCTSPSTVLISGLKRLASQTEWL